MNNNQHQDLPSNQQKLLAQLEQLAMQAATAQAEIASEAAHHEFRVRFQYYLQQKMKLAAEQTYAEVLEDVQQLVNQFAQKASARALTVESQTLEPVKDFEAELPQFTSFSQALAQERNQQSHLAHLQESKLLGEAEKLAAESLGISGENEEHQIAVFHGE